jgi:oxalate decarboxylase/phosphoglucose isomerase-like protein (cupin superfamily)
VHASAGSAILIPAGVAHCFRNVGPGEVSWLVVGAPAAAVTLIEEVAEVRAGELDRMAEIFARHNSELLERHPHWEAATPDSAGGAVAS